MPWPDLTEFTHFLQASGLYGLSPSSAQQLLDLQGALDAAVETWNDLTHYWPFLSTGDVNETRYFDPPEGCILDLNGGLVTFTSLHTDVEYDATNSLTAGTERVSVRDFRLCPTEAASRKKPWTYLKVGNWQGWWPGAGWHAGIPGSVGITGEWGFCTDANLPSAARRAVMALAAQTLLPQIQAELSRGGLIKLDEGDSRKEWGFRELKQLWDGTVNMALSQGYVRQRVSH